MELLLWDIFECIRMNKKFWRHRECIIRRLEEGRGGCILAGAARVPDNRRRGGRRAGETYATINKNIHVIVC